ncbi:LysR family transcriptional regulator [Nocardia donostiensis]|uniref:LysR family transcriptional regulator n=1 Tax=Nocardia donostiensis TaxID=1538463 RepID=UPI0009DB2BD7|nr:LysR family transcriptional regulator [Nocardia donostiensis]OQS15529.1 LysR family transcriptional regulator [Nocardia donostiensis]
MNRADSIEVTRLRWFVAVAEELHFARAAESLRISRQQLSRTVIDLERELGTTLFVPGAQPTQLTDAGRELLIEARAAVARADAARCEQAPETKPGLRVGFVPGVTVTKWERIWRERFPDIPLEMTPVAGADQLAALRTGRVDMCFVRLPIDRADLSVIPLYHEVAVVVVPKEHPISLFTEVATADLADEPTQDSSDLDDAAMTIELVAAGVGAAIVPHSIARLHARRDVVYRPVTDAAPTQIALAWPAAATTETVEEFVGVVRGRSAHSSRSPSARKAGGAQAGSDRKQKTGQPPGTRSVRSGASRKPSRRRRR